MSMTRKFLLACAILGLAGCNTDPATNVRQPMTIRPNPQPPVTVADGAIFHASSSRPLFEDRRARFVGDTLTVNLVEKVTGSTGTNGSSDRKGSAAVSVTTPTILGYTPKPPFALNVPGGGNNVGNSGNFDTNFTASSALKSENKSSDSNSTNFSGSIAVTVIEVLPNGNLAVSGEKQVSVNQNTKFIRLSGVVNPMHINSANAVNSTNIADARIETKEKQSVDTAQVISMLSRFFVALLPF